MKIFTVVGARPQFIKAAVVSRLLRKRAQEVLLHTGQHYDYNMSDIFFEELNIPKPDYNLGISGGSHGVMTGRMLTSVEEVLLKEQPDKLLVYGDTNSTIGSTDATHDILTSLQKKYPKLDVFENTDKQHGPKVIALYDYAIRKSADYVFQTDSDGQTNPDEFDMFWTLRKQYDGIFGRRDERGDGKSRAFVERVVCALLRIYFGVKIPDANAPFRLMKTEVVKKYLYRMHRDYNLPNIMMTTYYVHYGEKYKFIPVSFKPRQGGVNSINIPKIVGIGWRALGDFKMLKKGMN